MLIGDTGWNLINGNAASFFFFFNGRESAFFWRIEDVCFERSGVHGSTVCRARRVYSSSWGFNDEWRWFFVYLEKNAFETGYESLSH